MTPSQALDTAVEETSQLWRDVCRIVADWNSEPYKGWLPDDQQKELRLALTKLCEDGWRRATPGDVAAVNETEPCPAGCEAFIRQGRADRSGCSRCHGEGRVPRAAAPSRQGCRECGHEIHRGRCNKLAPDGREFDPRHRCGCTHDEDEGAAPREKNTTLTLGRLREVEAGIEPTWVELVELLRGYRELLYLAAAIRERMSVVPSAAPPHPPELVERVKDKLQRQLYKHLRITSGTYAVDLEDCEALTRAALSALPPAATPAWHDRPHAEGWWFHAVIGWQEVRPIVTRGLCFMAGQLISRDVERGALHWFGPIQIPEDPNG